MRGRGLRLAPRCLGGYDAQMRIVLASGLMGIVAALVSGLVEYVLTGGASTWIPLIAGLVGAVAGLIVGIRVLPRQEEQFYTPRTVTELTKAVRGKTSVEADTLNELHVGSRIRVSGEISDVSSTLFFSGYTVDLKLDDGEGASVNAEFSKNWFPMLRTLRVGDQVNIDGKITDISEWSIWIDDCRIAPDDPPRADM